MSSVAFEIDAPPVAFFHSNPYAVVFSPNGSRLAVGTGGWYGGGGVSLVDLQTGRDTTVRFVVPMHAEGVVVAPFDWGERPLTISGVAFDASGDFLSACAWSSGQRPAPAFLFGVAENTLEHLETFPPPPPPDPIFDICTTGLCFLSGRLHLRHNARRLDQVFSSVALPADVDTAVRHGHRAHRRVACAGEELITGGGGSLKLGGWSSLEGETEAFKAAPGLVVGPTARQVAAPSARVTAVLARPDGKLVTGGLEGEVVLWEREEEWRPVKRLRGETKRERPTGDGAWATYHPESVVGLCALEDGRFFSVDASGEVLEWHGDSVARSHVLPRPGTPRCIAVHPETPHGPLLAVGVKVDHPPDHRGYVACFSV